jgi:hypothetical protein
MVHHLLKDKHIDLEMKNNKHITALHIAVTITHENAETICRSLIDGGARLNGTDSLGNSPLHYAAEAGCAWAVSMLLDKGADGLFEDNDDCIIPLSVAVKMYMDQTIALEDDNIYANATYVYPNPSTIRVLMEAMVCNPLYGIHYEEEDPISKFFSNDIPDYMRKQISDDGLDVYYIRDSVIYKAQWSGYFHNILESFHTHG